MSEIPDKQYFKIGEVADITEVKPHVLRYWETEFRALKPQKTKTNQRLYHRRDVELLILIKRLLYKEGFTIAGANKRIREIARDRKSDAPAELKRVINYARKQINSIMKMAEDDADAGTNDDSDDELEA